MFLYTDKMKNVADKYIGEFNTLCKKYLTIENFEQYKNDPEFIAEYKHYLKDYSGRGNTALLAESLTEHLGGAKIYLKREDLNHLGSHKLNNVLGANPLGQTHG